MNDTLEQLDKAIKGYLERLRSDREAIEAKEAKEPILPLISSETEQLDRVIGLLERIREVL